MQDYIADLKRQVIRAREEELALSNYREVMGVNVEERLQEGEIINKILEKRNSYRGKKPLITADEFISSMSVCIHLRVEGDLIIKNIERLINENMNQYYRDDEVNRDDEVKKVELQETLKCRITRDIKIRSRSSES